MLIALPHTALLGSTMSCDLDGQACIVGGRFVALGEGSTVGLCGLLLILPKGWVDGPPAARAACSSTCTH
jgi:hypothetical protein